MNQEEFEKALSFAEFPDEVPFRRIFVAKFELRESRTVDEEVFRFAPYSDEVLKAIKQDLKHSILFRLYDDRRRELHKALHDFVIAFAHPWGPEFYEARDKLIRVALRQPSATIETLLKEGTCDSSHSKI